MPNVADNRVSNYHTERGRAYHLLGIVQSYAPNGLVQAKLAQDFSLVEKEHGIEVLAKYLVEILNDGLNHGNWPWVVPTTKTMATGKLTGD